MNMSSRLFAVAVTFAAAIQSGVGPIEALSAQAVFEPAAGTFFHVEPAVQQQFATESSNLAAPETCLGRVSAVQQDDCAPATRDPFTSPLGTATMPWPPAAQVVGDERKDPFVAGALSWLVPGLGSFYAENSRHGKRHLIILGGSVVALAAGWNSCISSLAGSCTLMTLGYVAWLGNDVWAIVTAVQDANAYNATLSSTSGEQGALVRAGEAVELRRSPSKGIDDRQAPSRPFRLTLLSYRW